MKLTNPFPLYITENLQSLNDFYQSNFGFTSVFFEPDFYLHLLHPGSGTQIGFLAPNHPSQPGFLHAAANTVGTIISLDVSNAKTAFETANANGLDILLTYTEEAWGQNHFILRDPQGFMIDIVEHTEKQS